MNIKRIIREELEGFLDSTKEDWEWAEDSTNHTVAEWLNDKELLNFLSELDKNGELDTPLLLNGAIGFNPSNSSQTIQLHNEPITILEIWPNSNFTAHDTRREQGDYKKGIMVIEFENDIPELGRRIRLQGKEWDGNVIQLGKMFEDYNMVLGYEY